MEMPFLSLEVPALLFLWLFLVTVHTQTRAAAILAVGTFVFRKVGFRQICYGHAVNHLTDLGVKVDAFSCVTWSETNRCLRLLATTSASRRPVVERVQ